MSNTRTQSAAGRHFRIVLPVAALLAALVAGCSDAPETDPETTATLIQPVARVELQTAEPETAAAGDTPETPIGAAAEAAAEGGTAAAAETSGRSGEEVYKASCSVCHAVGVAGAPKSGNAEDWAPRIKQGLDANVASVINGKGAMPPRGGSNATDDELRHAVIYMMNSAGANF